MTTSYPDSSAASCGGAAVLDPQPLTAELQGYWDTIADLWRNPGGYCWAKVEWFMRRWNVKRWKVYAILAKLRAFGRLIAQDVPGSHERRYIAVALPAASKPRIKRKSNENQTISCGTLRESEPAMRERQQHTNTRTDSTPAPVPPEPAVVVSLTQKGMERNTAKRLVALYGEKRAQAALALLAAQKGVKEAAGWLYRAIERGYQASGNGSEATEGRRHDAAHPSNRDTAANLAAARKAAPALIVRQPAPPPRSDLAGLTPWERLHALKAQAEGLTWARGQE